MTSSATPPAIGGYFEIDMGPRTGELYTDAFRFQSARAAFTSLLRHVKPSRIWMPWFNCESMLEAPAAAKVEVRRYSIDENLYPERLAEFGPADCLLYVDYFGVCGNQVARLLNEYPRERIIVDNSQAFYAPAPPCLAALYSPRKFFGVPDGGYLVTRVPIEAPEVQDVDSIDRIKPMLVRFAEGPEAGHSEAKRANLSLKGQPPMAMSALTQAMLGHLDYAGSLRRRNANFEELNCALASVNRFPLPASTPPGPLCYPFFTAVDGLHEWLIEHRVFVPRYWPGVRGAGGIESDWESTLARRCVPLPCDQRYDATDMKRVAGLVMEYLDAHEEP
jgi:hypothetical protein